MSVAASSAADLPGPQFYFLQGYTAVAIGLEQRVMGLGLKVQGEELRAKLFSRAAAICSPLVETVHAKHIVLLQALSVT